MLLPVAETLKLVHQEGLIHRDIAPDNLFLTKDGKIKLIDFGAARFATTQHSRSLSVFIKEGYSAEEQYRSRGKQGAYTDIYALGAVLYHRITGEVPIDVTPVTVSNNASTPSVSSSNNNVSTPSSKSDASSTISNNANTADHTPILLYIIICALSMLGIGFSFPHKDKY